MSKLSTLILMSMVAPVAYGQTTIQGVVKDRSSMIAIPGVTISIKGKAASAKTDATGSFQITASPTDSLVFNFLGYQAQTMYVGNQTQLNVFLENTNQALEEVVVIGYGTQKKADLTGSINSLKSSDIVKQPAMSAMQSIQGKAAGLNIVASEKPGSSPNVILRGLGTALSGRAPLYIVDGISQANINNINPSDIESIDVLKDASSASIYGLRAANGVIIVTTKKGKTGFSNINYESYAGIKTILNRVKMANGSQYVTYFNEKQQSILGVDVGWRLKVQQPNETDWYDEILKTGSVFNNAVNLSGGTERVDYFFSANNFTENGILDGSKYTRNTIRNNNVYKFLDNRLKFFQNANVTFTRSTPKPDNAFNNAYKQSPLVPVLYNNGRYGISKVNQTTGIVGYEGAADDVFGNLNTVGNPVYEVKQYNQLINTIQLQGSFEGEFKINDFLKFNSRIGGNRFYSKNRVFNDIKDAWLNAEPSRTDADFAALKQANPDAVSYANNSLSYEDLEQSRWAWENFLTFNKTFDKHHLEAVLGMSREKYDINSLTSLKAYDVPNQEQYWNINLANSEDYDVESRQTYYTPRALASYFGRVQYNYDSRYYLTATLRRDGSSVFRNTGEYWGTFPSVGLGWTITNEAFMKDASWINLLKLRGNWGKLGNQDIPLNVSTILSAPGSANYNYVFGPEQNIVLGAAYGTPAVDLGWEVTRETGVGLDFAFLNNNLSGSIDYYHKLNTNVILDVTPTYTSPSESNFYDHGGKVLNQGIELALNWNKTVSPDLNYTIGVNYAYNKNEISEVKPAYDGAQGGSLSNGEITKQLRVGQPIYAWWMYEADGVWQTQDEIDNNAALGSPKPGYLRYKDQNDDGVIDSRDRKFFGSFIPSSTYGVNVGVNYKAFDFGVSGYGVAGNKIYNGLKSTRFDGGENIALSTFENRWNGAGTSNVHPGADRDYIPSNYYLESGAYFRINNITLGYTFNKLYSTNSKLRIYVTAQNPFIFTNYSGFSPEIVGDGSPNATSGIELTAYPTTRNFLFGLNMQF